MEIALALAVLVVAAAPMLILAAAIRLTTKGRVVFSQQRVGAHGRLFRIYKFRTMTEGGKEDEIGLTRADDDRVTALGRYLRRFKLDELPQFWNVLRGDMSLIGPRPKLPQDADLVNMPYRPGITGAASVAFCREEDMLRDIDSAKLDDFYARNIRPIKRRLDACYISRATAGSDLRILAKTLLCCIGPATTPTNLVAASTDHSQNPIIADEQNALAANM